MHTREYCSHTNQKHVITKQNMCNNNGSPFLFFLVVASLLLSGVFVTSCSLEECPAGQERVVSIYDEDIQVVFPANQSCLVWYVC